MKRIVVVDDNNDIWDLMCVIFEMEGYVIETCRNAVSLHMTLREPPDLIILDVFLESANGCDLCRQLKQDEHTCHIPIILMSAHLPAREALADGLANGFLEKPFRIDDLLVSVKPYVGNRRDSIRAATFRRQAMRQDEQESP
jgi:CheY-like chemotaxis protein